MLPYFMAYCLESLTQPFSNLKFNWRHQGLKPGPSEYQSNTVPTELSWLDVNQSIGISLLAYFSYFRRSLGPISLLAFYFWTNLRLTKITSNMFSYFWTNLCLSGRTYFQTYFIPPKKIKFRFFNSGPILS